MNGYGNNSFLGKELGPLTVGQLIAMIVASLIGILILDLAGAGSLPVLLIVAVIVYMLPHMLGATPGTKAVYGIVFAIVTLVVGAFVVGPACIDSHNAQEISEKNGISYTIEGDNLTVNTEYTGSEPVLKVAYTELEYVAFNSITYKSTEYRDMVHVSGTSYTCDFSDLGHDKLYNLCIVPADSEGNLLKDQASYASLDVYNFTGDKTNYTLPGTGLCVFYIMILFFIILGLTTLMRNRLNNTRQRMEAAGRLYPQGYGRCTFCGAIVLPGEVNCRKCGAYIDRPDSMKPKKKDYLACSVCGAEITSDMTVCPKCGAKFDGEESVVTHADGSEEVGTEMMPCPECGKEIPKTSERCIFCGKKFDE